MYGGKKNEYVHKKPCTKIFIATLFVKVPPPKSSQLETSQISTNNRMDKQIGDYHIHILQYYPVIKKNVVLIHAALTSKKYVA